MSGALIALLAAGHMAAAAPPPIGPAEACRRAAATAERRWALPANLLLAIGRVESGRIDPATGQTQPWPWSADVSGEDYVFSSAAEAGTVVGFLQERGIASIDIGCFQVNLHYHPAAFASVAAGFDPDANADYAARFLRRLFERTGDWGAAVGSYHSADPALADDYRARVLQVWSGLGAAAAAAIPVYTPATLPAAWRAALGLPAKRQR